MASEPLFGLTPPMSVALPTEAERRASDALIEELRRQKTFESPSDTQKRHVVLESLQHICDAFVKHVAKIKEPKNDALIKNARGKVLTYGSFRLGVFGPGSDIDTLIVAPKYVTRTEYFLYFPDLLVSMAPKGAITDLSVVTDAFVPIIKFEYSGISIDLIFSRIIQKQLAPDFEDLRDSGLLRGLDEAELRSLNGTRVTDEILTLVPEQSTFKLALRAIKLWAQRRAIYANIMGFPGGVAWAMLVARVCQLYPKATMSVIVNKFFLVIGKWRWPHPVLLKPVESGPLPVRVWNPRLHKGDSFHIMPVITPAYPSMCATFNITRSSMTIITEELHRGLELSENIMMGRRPWSDLFAKHTFFTANYKYYMTVISASKSKDAHRVWAGYVESKVRMLVQKLEQHPSIKMARAFNKGYERRHRCKNEEEIALVQDGSQDYVVTDATCDDVTKEDQPKDAVNTEPVVLDESIAKPEAKPEADADGNSAADAEPATDAASGIKAENGEGAAAPEPPKPSDIYTSTHYIGLDLKDTKTALDLSYQVDEFKALCTSWQKYKDELSPFVSIGVQHVRNFNLPDDVFEPGEQKPQRKSGGTKGQPNGKKRGPSEDNPPAAKRQQASIAAVG